ncbi:glycoside hydrolase family 26 protein [Streptomyces sp. NPDC051315]|uniref:glycoside hydrolase family 26 protein n=1 Tax=Streptomyces sp. NPDC051315 TaxID=3365650 RepID=UPI00379931A4
MGPRQRRARSRRLAVVAATVAVSAALVSGPGFAAGAGAVVAEPPAPTPTAPAVGTPSAPAPVPTVPAAVPTVPAVPEPSTVPPPAPAVATPSAPAPAETVPAAVPTVPAVPEPSTAPPPAPAVATPSAPAPAPTAPAGAPTVPAVPEPSTVPPPDPAVGTPSPGARPAFGAYLDYGARGVAGMALLSEWLGGAELRVGHTYLPGDRWSNIEGRVGFLDVWADWRKEKDDRMLVLNVPMLERNEEGVPDHEVRKLLRQGAAGQFGHHFSALAERLVGLRVPDTVIVLGWEMNGTTYTHRCGPDPEAWKTYWNRIVSAMRAVPGQGFTFDFTPNRGRDAVPWTHCYPGDDTVDIVGMDSYDQPAGLSFDEQVREPYGLQDHVDFAKSHGKPISYPEWGLFRNGDNPAYMRRMLAWMDEHQPLYNTLTDYCPHGVWQCSHNPKASEVYRAVLSGRPDGPVTGPTTPTPTTPAPTTAAPTPPTPPHPPKEPTTPPASRPPASCPPLDLGWIEHWLGRRICVRLDRWSPQR